MPNIGLVANVPGDQRVLAGNPSKISGISITDPDLFSNATVTVVVSDSTGLLSAATVGGVTASGSGTTSLTLTGHLADLNATLANLTYLSPTGQIATADRIDVRASDSAGAGDTERIAVAVLQVPSLVTNATTAGFKTADQSMWTSGKALSIDDQLTLLSVGIGPLSFSAFDGDFTASASANASLVLNISANTGGISLDYPLLAGVQAPNAVAAGQQFTVHTLANGLATGAALTGKFPTFDISLDANFSATISAGIDSDLLGSDSFNYDINKTYTLFDLKSGEKKDLDGFHFEIPADYAHKSNQIVAGPLPQVVLDATTPDIASVSVDVIKLIGDLIGPEFPSLSGSLLGGAVRYDIISAVLHAGVAIAQQFTFVPVEILADIKTPWNDEVIVPVGQDASFVVPANWTDPVTLTTTYSISGNLVNNSGLVGNADLDVSVLSGSADIFGSFGPLYHNDFPIYTGSPIYFINPGGPGGFELQGFNSPVERDTIALAALDPVAPDLTEIDIDGFSANAAAAIQSAISRLAGRDKLTNLYDPSHNRGNVAAVAGKFNIELLASDGTAHTLPSGFQAGILNGGGTGSRLVDTAGGGVLLAAGSAGDTLSGIGNDTLVGGQGGGVRFEIPANFTGEIDGLNLGDVIDIAGITASAASIGGSTLNVTYGSGSTLAVAVSGDLGNGKIVTQSDGHGGTNLTLYRLAAARVGAGSRTVTVANAHLNDPSPQTFLTIANIAANPAEALAIGNSRQTTGAAFITGSLASSILPGSSSTSEVAVGIQTGQAGSASGTVTFTPFSDGTGVQGDGTTTTLSPITLTVTGNVYRLAQPRFEGANTVRVGDSGTIPITIANRAAADGYSENLVATLLGTQGNITASGTTTGPIAPGASSNALSLSVPTTSAGFVFGQLALGLMSDGTGIDGLGTTSLPFGSADVQIAVNGYAQPTFGLAGSVGTLTQGSDGLTLGLGTVAQTMTGQTGVQTALRLANSALSGPQDQLGGTFSISGSRNFNNEGFGPLNAINAGSDNNNLLVFLNADRPGTFSETVTYTPTSINSSSTATLAAQRITITGTIAAPSVVAPASVRVPLGENGAIAGISVSDSGQTPTVSVQVTDSLGTLSVNPSSPFVLVEGNGVVGEGSQSLRLTGSLLAVNDALATLHDRFSFGGPDVIHVTGSILDGPGSGLPLVGADIAVNPNALFNFVYQYADGAAQYTGTVTDDGSLGYATLAASANPTIVDHDGTYRLSAAGMTALPGGIVTIASYTDLASGRSYSLNHANDGGRDGPNGLGSESQQFFVNSVPHMFAPHQAAGTLPAPLPQQIEDFNADHTSDILWQRSDGGLMIYNVSADAVASATQPGSIGAEWRYKGIGDFNGNGTSDVLWQRGDGGLMVYNIVNNRIAATPGLGSIGAEWRTAGIGDFDADGTSDILWRRSDGELMIYRVVADNVTQSPDIGHIGREWHADGIGDFNGDGTSDALWQRTDGRLMIYEINAGHVTSSVDIGNIGAEWNFLATGDFNGDGTSDALWQRANGELMVYQFGNHQVAASPVIGSIGREWTFLDSGDYDGDGTSDILWERGNGGLMVYTIKQNQVVSSPTIGSIGAEWRDLPFNVPPVIVAS